MAGRMKDIKKGQYYVWYLGWKEARGLYGREFTEPIVRELLGRRNTQHNLPKLTVVVSKKDVKITQEVEKKKGKIEKVKYPPIPSADVTYACQALSPDRDVVACIFLGFNPYTNSACHVHVYRCDSEETANILVQHFNQLIELPEHKKRHKKVERDLAERGHIQARLTQPSDGRSSNTSSRSDPGDTDDRNVDDVKARDDIANDITPYDSLAAELNQKLHSDTAPPLLLPPKDYDTICRRHGNLEKVDIRKPIQTDTEGGHIDSRADSGNGSGESDIPSPNSEYPEQISLMPREGDIQLQNVVPSWKQTQGQFYYPTPEGAPYSLTRIFEGQQPPQPDYNDVLPHQNYESMPRHSGELTRHDSSLTHSSHQSYQSGDSRESGNSGNKYEQKPPSLIRRNSNPHEGSGLQHGGYYGDISSPSPPTGYDPPQVTSRHSANHDPRVDLYNEAIKHSRTRSDEGYNSVSDATGFYDTNMQMYMHGDRKRNSGNISPERQMYSSPPPVPDKPTRGQRNVADYPPVPYLGASMPEVELRKHSQEAVMPQAGMRPPGAVGVLPRVTRPLTADTGLKPTRRSYHY